MGEAERGKLMGARQSGCKLMTEVERGEVMVARAERGMLMADAEAGKLMMAEAEQLYHADGGGQGEECDGGQGRSAIC